MYDAFNDVTVGDPRYAQRIYDDMGDQFEDKLVMKLGYRGPWNLYELLREVIEEEDEGEGEGEREREREGIEGDGEEGEGKGERGGGGGGGECNENIEPNNKHFSNETVIPNERKRNLGERKNSKYPKKGFWRILDLGCGSGLCGKVFQELVKTPVLKNHKGEGLGGEGRGGEGIGEGLGGGEGTGGEGGGGEGGDGT
jgi:hypothetical protein